MIVEDYISFYELLHVFPVYWNFNEKISISEFIDDNPEYELDEYDLERIYSNERYSLSNYLKRFKDERELISMLRTMFDQYRRGGGDPLVWLHFTFDSVSLNPQIYPPEHLGIIEKSLIQWIENFKKQPYDLLAFQLKSREEKEFGEGSKGKIAAPVFALFCSIVHQSEIIEMGFDESNQSYCQRVSEFFDIPVNPKKARQFFNKIMDIKATNKYLKKVFELILPNIPSDAKQKIEIFIDNKTKLYG